MQGTAGLFEAWNAAGRHILDFFHNSEVIEKFRQLDPAVLRVALWTESEMSNAETMHKEISDSLGGAFFHMPNTR